MKAKTPKAKSRRRVKAPRIRISKSGKRYILLGKKRVFIDENITERELLKFILKRILPKRRRRAPVNKSKEIKLSDGRDLQGIINQQREREKTLKADIEAEEKRNQLALQLAKDLQEQLKAPPKQLALPAPPQQFALPYDDPYDSPRSMRSLLVRLDPKTPEVRVKKSMLDKGINLVTDELIAKAYPSTNKNLIKLAKKHGMTDKYIRQTKPSAKQLRDFLEQKGVIDREKFRAKAADEVIKRNQKQPLPEFDPEQHEALPPSKRTEKATAARLKKLAERKRAKEAEVSDDESDVTDAEGVIAVSREEEQYAKDISARQAEYRKMIDAELAKLTTIKKLLEDETIKSLSGEREELERKYFVRSTNARALDPDYFDEKFAEIQKGSGTKYAGLYSTEIDKIMSKLPNYLGTISSDQIVSQIVPRVKPKSRGAFVMNLDKHNQKGSHWVAVYFDARDNGSNSIEYYDSYGTPPTKDFMRQIKYLAEALNAQNYLQLKVNRIKEQTDDSYNCGWHSARFIMDRFRGRPFRECTGFDDSMKSEQNIETFKQKFPKFKYVDSFARRQEGEGIIDSIKNFASEAFRRIKNFFAGINEMSPKLKRFMDSPDGTAPIQLIKISRAPIESAVRKIMDIISLGRIQENLHSMGYDDVYHLAISFKVNGKWFTFDKRPRWEMSNGELDTKGIDLTKLESINIPVNKTISISQLFMNAIQKVGQQRFFSYSGSSNNCQDGVIYLLSSSDLLHPRIKDWIKQDTAQLLKNTGVLQPVANFITGLKHRFDGLFGKGKK